MRHFLAKQKNIILGTFLVGVGVFIGFAITSFPMLLARYAKVNSQENSQRQISVATDVNEQRKQSLEKFYNEISTAQDNRNWGALYYLVPQSVRDNLTKEQFISAYDAGLSGTDKFLSRSTIIHNIEVSGDNGIVDRTVFTCLAEDCTGDNRVEDNARREFIYINGKWQIPDIEPTERALKAASYAYEYSSASDKKKVLEMFGYGSENSTYAIRNWAVHLDNNLEELIRVETLIEKSKTEESRPVYQPPAIIQQPAPQLQNRDSPNYPRHCTSSTIGNYTYTDCY